MLAAQQQSITSSSRVLRSNYMNALSNHRSSSAPNSDQALLSSPESHPEYADDGFTIEMSDLMLPASDLESELFGIRQTTSAATVVSASSSDELQETNSLPSVVTTSRSSKRKSSSNRSQAFPSHLMLTEDGDAVTQPVPEFLCHLFSMLRDPSYDDLISWEVPSEDEPDVMGGGIRGIGKIVVHQPEALQDFVLGKYYRHSKYASFQRQLNYFGFKKRLHGGKKGKLSPCSYIHETLTEDVGSLFTLKRRPPAKKRAADAAAEDAASVEEKPSRSTKKSSKRRRVTIEKRTKKSKRESSSKKSSRRTSQGKQQVVITSAPIQVTACEFGAPSVSAPSVASSLAIQANRLKPVVSAPNTPVTSSSFADVQRRKQQPRAECQPSQPTLMELLSTSLPPSDVLFNDDVDCVDDDGMPAWVTDDGQYHYHNVDSSLVDLAMLY